MANQRFLLLVFVFMAMINTGLMTEPAYTASCDAILGKWAWFTKGVVTFNPDGTMVHEPGNDGTWESPMPRGEGLRSGGDKEDMLTR